MLGKLLTFMSACKHPCRAHKCYEAHESRISASDQGIVSGEGRGAGGRPYIIYLGRGRESPYGAANFEVEEINNIRKALGYFYLDLQPARQIQRRPH
jgi:hypothetical protein